MGASLNLTDHATAVQPIWRLCCTGIAQFCSNAVASYIVHT